MTEHHERDESPEDDGPHTELEPAVGTRLQWMSIDDLVAQVVKPWFPPKGDDSTAVSMAIGVFRRGAEHPYFFGHTIKDGTAEPTAKTLYQVGSLTKNFTTTLLALFERRGLVAFDDKLEDRLPRSQRPLPEDRKGITLMMLANHKSRLPKNVCEDYKTNPLTLAGMYDGLKHCPFAKLEASDNGFSYSNLGIALLGHALGHTIDGDTGIDSTSAAWRAALVADVTGPLHMVDTRVVSQLTPGQIERRAHGYRGKASKQAEWESWRQPVFNPAGGLYSSLDDMMKWLRYNIGHEQKLETAELAAILPVMRRYHPAANGQGIALAWNISTLEGNCSRLYWKSGSTPGFNAFIGFVPDDDTGVVVLQNFHTAKAKDTGFAILRALH